MTGLRWAIKGTLAVLLILASGSAHAQNTPAPSTVVTEIDLSTSFKTRSPWRLVVLQGPDVANAADAEAGELRLCLETHDGDGCARELPSMPSAPPADPSPARYLNTAELVYSRGASEAPLLLVQTASMHAVNGNQAIYTQLYSYRDSTDQFVRVYDHVTGRNNNQEVRYIASGPLAGSVISAEPTQDGPFGYWITVNRFGSARTYTQALRYRSATRYNDGNPLNVIDSEMPNLQARLGVWRSGMPLPLPAGPCPKPRLIHVELWCS